MGRYYSGDIEGKFWFGVQASNAASRFGGTEMEPSYIEYSFDVEDLPGVEEEIASITTTIGEDNTAKLDELFDQVNGYNDTILKEYGILEVFNTHISDYADLHLGRQIRDCIKDTGYCSFEAEL